MAEYLPALANHIEVAANSTVSTTALKAEGVRLVLFAFDTDEELSEHTAAVPVLLQALSGALDVSASGQDMTLRPGDLIHLASREPHSVKATQPSIMLLTMLDAR